MMESFDRSKSARQKKMKLCIIATGSLSACHLPFWLNWLRENRPGYEVTVGITEAGARFVTPTSIRCITGRSCLRDSWPDDPDGSQPNHVLMAKDFDAFLVYPASWNFLSGLASARGDRVFQLALLATHAPVILAPAFPPGVEQNTLVAAALESLRSVDNFALLDGAIGKSEATGEKTLACPPMWEAIAALEHLRKGD